MRGLLRVRRLWLGGLLVMAGLAGAAIAWRDTTMDPVIRETHVALPGLSQEAGPVRLVFIADTHVAGPLRTPEALARTVRRINALHPDIVLIGGDYTGDVWFRTHRYAWREAIAPLGGLHARYGVAAVLGNHDYSDAPPRPAATRYRPQPPVPAQSELERVGIAVLRNEARKLGPVTVVGRDIRSGSQFGGMFVRRAMAAAGPPFVGFGHENWAALKLPPEVHLVFAGNLHCGQIRIPLLVRLWTGLQMPSHYACGLIEEDGRTLIETAGLGESNLPVRFLAPPDIWLVTLTPAPADDPPSTAPQPSGPMHPPVD